MKGHLVKRGDTWTAVLDMPRIAGKRQQKWIRLPGIATKSDASTALRKLLTEYEQTQYLQPTDMTVEEVLRKWLSIVKNDIRPVTFERYKITVDVYLAPKLGAIPLAKLRPLDVSNHVACLRECGARCAKPLKRSTVQIVMRILRCAIAWAVRMRLVAYNVCDNVKSAPGEPHEARFCEVTEIEQLLSYLRLNAPHYYAPVVATVGLGLRRGEVLGLSWDDVDFDTGVVTVRRTRVQVGRTDVFSLPKTQRSRREIAMPSFVAFALKAHQAEQNKLIETLGSRYNDQGVVFPDIHGDPWKLDAFGKHFVRLAERAGLKDVSLHSLRHSCASLLLSRGLPLPAVAAVMGHSNTAVTARTYAHAMAQAKEDAAARMDDALKVAVDNATSPPKSAPVLRLVSKPLAKAVGQ